MTDYLAPWLRYIFAHWALLESRPHAHAERPGSLHRLTPAAKHLPEVSGQYVSRMPRAWLKPAALLGGDA